jgi:hypothetical protein
MDADLQYLVHFFNDPQYLFKTITMAEASRVDEICDQISSQKGWFWVRFSQSERRDYLERRRFVERSLYEDYTREYGSLKEKIPVFFYLVPRITKQKAIELARQRTGQGEAQPHVLMVSIADLEDTTNLTFTLNDSHTAYWKRIQEAGFAFGGEKNVPVVLPDHNRVYPFSKIEAVYQRYRAQPVSFEIQVWDYSLLEKIRYTILGKDEG